MSTAVTGPSIVVLIQCRWWLLPFCRDLNDSPLRSNQWRTAWMQSVNAGRVLLSLSMTYSCVSSVYFRFGQPCLLFPVVGRCCNHLRTLSLNSWRSKTPTLPLEFWRYLSQFQRYKYFRVGRPYCYFRFFVADAITRALFYCKALLARASHVKWRYTKYLALTFNLYHYNKYLLITLL